MPNAVTKAIADVRKIRGYVDTYLAVDKPLNAKQKAALATDLGTLEKDLQTLEDASQRPDTALADLSEAARQAINAAFAAWVLANGRQPDYPDWPAVLGPELFGQALEGGYFVGFPPGIFDNSTVKGVSVMTWTQTDANDTDTRWAALLNDGKEVTRKQIGSVEDFDDVAWAKELGYDLTQHTPE